MIIASAIVTMTTVITVVLMTMTMITKLGNRGPGALRVGGGGEERVDSAQQWRSLALLALAGPQLISTLSLFILVTVFRPTHLPQVQFGKNSLILESQRNF
jgi:hypothetical protein